MSPRRRNSKKTGWPANLYERGGYFSWRNPVDGREIGLGRIPKGEAFAQAVEANLHVADLLKKPRLIDRLTGGEAPRTVRAWFDRYDELLAQHELAENTRRSYRSLGRRARLMFGETTPLRAITALMCSEGLDAIARGEGKARLAQALRAFLRDAFREARAQGWYTDENPIHDTKLAVRPAVKRARLTLDTLRLVLAAEKPAWLQNAVELAVVSGQRREDIARAQFRDVHDGAWWCQQQKGGSRVLIPLGLRLDVLGLSLEEVVSRCRRTGIVSQYLVHQTVERGNSPIGRRIWKDTLSRRFSDVMEALKLDWEGKEAPTFHELRSLAERLYAAQGDVDTQQLLGHRDAGSTAIYHNSRGADWVRVTIGKTTG